MAMHGPRGMFGGPPQNKTASNFGPSAKRLLGRLRTQKIGLSLVFAVTIISQVLGVFGPKVLGSATNEIFKGLIGGKLPAGVSKESIVQMLRSRGQDQFADMVAGMDLIPGVGIDFNAVAKIILTVIALYFASAVFQWIGGYVMSGIAQKLVYELRREVQAKLARVPMKYVDGQSRGDLLSRVTNDIDNIGNTFQQGLGQMLSSFVAIIGTLAMMFWISPLLAVISIIVVPASFFLTTVIGKRSQKEFASQWMETGKLNSHVEEMHTGHAIVLSYGHREKSVEEFDAINSRLYTSSFRAQFLSGIIQPLMMLLSNFNYVSIAIIGAFRVASGSMSLGDVQAFIQYSRQFGFPLAQLASQANLVQSGVASAERVFELLDAEEEPAEPRGSKQTLSAPRGRVELSNVHFRYREDTPLIHDVNITVEPGQTVAIVGPTGAGKTTIVNLLMRFYEIDAGTITIDGVNTRDMARGDLRSVFSMVLQDTWLFGGTIRENIAYGRDGASDEDITNAAIAAHADHFIRTLPNGYDTILDDDATNISVGERQLLTIARAFLADPAILILDEATSNVDTRTEVLIQRAMADLRSGRTGFVIAHRLSTIRNADQILVMQNGGIVEHGNHETLIAAGGFYKGLYQSQFEKALTE
ncbi:MAG: hypothetical protein RL410_607 [Actinomycetota bacterium]|jgi:ATP-binding cassette subfamily B protein